ncbi:sce7726 family protein [Pararhizobium sp. BT-229]|uniref:sce7726 family protein n=1 Tax=Pararhizobium sp. BT-229 TaxID=2986923 RepID=UPI0021F7853B|nr:sce7726 family protein [Pararhizobium sp. BT-229]MCV9960453.1 sce7726 family protein [Pararhizobium sp. BT-229]
MTEIQTATTTDAHIRAPLLQWLRALHPDCLDAKLLEEFKMPRPSARIDVALVNGEMAGFEIKSDRDTLTRLPWQIPAFSKFFDRVSLVTTPKHVPEARMKIPRWWGIIVFRENGSFDVSRSPKRNSKIDAVSFLFALSKSELASVAREAGVIVPGSLKKEAMVETIASSIQKPLLCSLAREVIKLRDVCA